VRRLTPNPAIHGILVQLAAARAWRAGGPGGAGPGQGCRCPDRRQTSACWRRGGRPRAMHAAGLHDLLRETVGDLAGLTRWSSVARCWWRRPVAQLLLAANPAVTITHSKTATCRRCAGRPTCWWSRSVSRKWSRRMDQAGRGVIDVGSTAFPFRRVRSRRRRAGPRSSATWVQRGVRSGPLDHAGAGRVGLMTVACPADNTVTAAKRIAGIHGRSTSIRLDLTASPLINRDDC